MLPAVVAEFTSPGPLLFQIGPIAVRWYGLLIALAVLLGLVVSTRLARRRGIDPGLITDLLPILVLSAVVGARLYYVAFEWRSYQGQWLEALAIWKGGIAIHGALIAGTLSVWLFCRWNRLSFISVMDVLVPSVALGQAIGRWGNFFNSEAFGLPTDLPWRLTIPANQAIAAGFPGERHFHPTFLYESLWNLLVFGLLLVLFQQGRQGRIRLPDGALTCTYLISYSLGRLWIEGLRIDPLCLIGLPPSCEGGLRMAQLMSILLMLVGGLGLWWLLRQAPRSSAPPPETSR
ncbi:prolipoprotein diacylglyceryl transferase [Synechococcus sp. RSCCF101]|uniref:prolipoprotein diacylglyceryl transferase n=1 Tax=Synechococcus sp. RSCCF101 TaxID=2511069 RepID=UPI0012484ECA|nr:prolipoprotein diacylglyceryl transferase [Synechococcus sp. RSCCF101]QEY30960.1 prolipoprotein diacylglyceryl transferase [Synechococcus sp. RSCCF101]